MLFLFLIMVFAFLNSCNSQTNENFCNSESCVTEPDLNIDDAAVEVRLAINLFQTTSLIPSALLPTFNILAGAFNRKIKTIKDSSLCVACHTVLGTIMATWRSGITTDTQLKDMLIFICITTQERTMCEHVVEWNLRPLLYIIENRKELTAHHICATVFQNKGCDGQLSDWSIEIPGRQKKRKRKGRRSKKTPLKILHLTDVHYDPHYRVGSTAFCDRPICCSHSTEPLLEEAAGYWGDYHYCDAPMSLIDDTLRQINESAPDINYVYFTGDVIHHRIWDTSVTKNVAEMRIIFAKFKETFGNIPVYPALGNHEAHPVNLFSPLNMTNKLFDIQWLYDEVADIWSHWLPKSALSTVRQGGFYTVLVKRGFRLIVLNSNVCFTFNWWILFDDIDQYGQLKWMTDVLRKAEKKKESVHILSHVPTTDSTCYKPWSRQFSNIVKRFYKTITGIFTGHTHEDELTMYRKNSKPINVAWNGGSLTTYAYVNPNYRIYHVDGKNFEVLDYDQWTFNLSMANFNPQKKPAWYKMYSFKEAYKVDSLSPKNIKILFMRMVKDVSLFNSYYRFRSRDCHTTDNTQKCDAQCKNEYFCNALKSYSDDTFFCTKFIPKPKKESRITKALNMVADFIGI